MGTANDLVDGPGFDLRPVQLRYCRRCGALCALPEEAADACCPACACALRWLYGEVGDAARKR
jgi:hypothetical protein